uniref:Uncharacterized protein n=1 Tax=Hyaloperonospora arabidopsidis (strain Emoy2) TaxID=559515 RepID=M4B6A3_HYAAE
MLANEAGTGECGNYVLVHIRAGGSNVLVLVLVAWTQRCSKSRRLLVLSVGNLQLLNRIPTC